MFQVGKTRSCQTAKYSHNYNVTLDEVKFNIELHLQHVTSYVWLSHFTRFQRVKTTQNLEYVNLKKRYRIILKSSTKVFYLSSLSTNPGGQYILDPAGTCCSEKMR